MYRCSEVVRLISSDQYRSAGILKKLMIRIHLAMCQHCRRYVRQLRAIAAAVGRSDGAPPASSVERAKSRILQHLSNK